MPAYRRLLGSQQSRAQNQNQSQSQSQSQSLNHHQRRNQNYTINLCWACHPLNLSSNRPTTVLPFLPGLIVATSFLSFAHASPFSIPDNPNTKHIVEPNSKLSRSGLPSNKLPESLRLDLLQKPLSNHYNNVPRSAGPTSLESLSRTDHGYSSQQFAAESGSPTETQQPTRHESIFIPLKSPIPTYYENLNGIWFPSDNWRLYGLSGPTQRHRARSLPATNNEGNELQPATNSALTYHNSLQTANELESNNASLGSGNGTTTSGSSSKLYLPAGWNHTSPRGPLYVVPAIVITSLFIAIAVVGTVVCCVGRRKAAKRRTARPGNELGIIQDEEIRNTCQMRGRKKQLMIIQIRKFTMKKSKKDEGDESVVVVDECRRPAKRIFFTGLGRLNHRRWKVGIVGKKRSDEIVDDKESIKERLETRGTLDTSPVHLAVRAMEPQDEPPGPQPRSTAPTILNTHAHSSPGETHSSFPSPRLTTYSNLQSLESSPLSTTIVAGQTPLADTQSDASRSPRHRSHSTAASPSTPPPLPPHPLEAPRSPSTANLHHTPDPEPPPGPPSLSLLPPAYSGRPSRAMEKRPAPPLLEDSSAAAWRPEDVVVAHIATDDKSVLGHIATLASAPTVNDNGAAATSSEQDVQGPSAPPLVWDGDGFKELDDLDESADVGTRGSVLPEPSLRVMTSFDPLLSHSSASTFESASGPPGRVPSESPSRSSEKERNEMLWTLLVEPSAPETLQQVSSSRPTSQDLALSIPIVPPYEENALLG